MHMVLDFSMYILILFHYASPVFIHIPNFSAGYVLVMLYKEG